MLKRMDQSLHNILLNFKNKCPNTNIRIISHSLGAAVVDSALVNLNNNSNWNE